MQEHRVVDAHPREEKAREQVKEIDLLAQEAQESRDGGDREGGRREHLERPPPEEADERDKHQRKRTAEPHKRLVRPAREDSLQLRARLEEPDAVRQRPFRTRHGRQRIIRCPARRRRTRHFGEPQFLLLPFALFDVKPLDVRGDGRPVEDEEAAIRVRRTAQLRETPFGVRDLGRRTIQGRQVRPKADTAQADGDERDKEAKADAKTEARGRQTTDGGQRLTGGARRLFKPLDNILRVARRDIRKRGGKSDAEESRRLPQDGQRRDHQRHEADLRREPRDGQVAQKRAARRIREEPMERVVDHEPHHRRAEDDRHQVDLVEEREQRGRPGERGDRERRGEKRDPADAPEREDRKKRDEHERKDAERVDLPLAVACRHGRVQRHAARRDPHGRELRLRCRRRRVQVDAKGDERVRVRRDLRTQPERQDQRLGAVRAVRGKKAVPQRPVPPRRHLRAHEAVREGERVVRNREERRHRRGVVVLQGVPRETRTTFRRLQKPHVIQRRETVAVGRKRGKGILVCVRRQLLRRQKRANRAQRGGGRCRRLRLRPGQHRHEVGGRRAHGRGNGLRAVPDEVVERGAKSHRTHEAQAGRNGEQREGRAPQDGAPPSGASEQAKGGWKAARHLLRKRIVETQPGERRTAFVGKSAPVSSTSVTRRRIAATSGTSVSRQPPSGSAVSRISKTPSKASALPAAKASVAARISA